jgi:hypothetical protein
VVCRYLATCVGVDNRGTSGAEDRRAAYDPSGFRYPLLDMGATVEHPPARSRLRSARTGGWQPNPDLLDANESNWAFVAVEPFDHNECRAGQPSAYWQASELLRTHCGRQVKLTDDLSCTR